MPLAVHMAMPAQPAALTAVYFGCRLLLSSYHSRIWLPSILSSTQVPVSSIRRLACAFAGARAILYAAQNEGDSPYTLSTGPLGPSSEVWKLNQPTP